MKIYTKTGDEGQTGLIGSARVPKHSLRIHVIGDVDELNASIGLAMSHEDFPESVRSILEATQHRLFDVGAEIACEPGGSFQMHSVDDDDIQALEDGIDAFDTELEELKAFILPGGSAPSAALHYARCVCRRAERSLLSLHEKSPIRAEVRRYLNRLSDYLFAAARFVNYKLGAPDVIWKKKETLKS